MLAIFLAAFVYHARLFNPVPFFIPQRRDLERVRALIAGVIARRGV